MQKTWFIILIILLFGCSTENANPTLDPVKLEVALQQTLTAQGETPVQLISPINGASLNKPQVQLIWDWLRPLAPNEYFDVRIWKEGEPHNGITWHDGSIFDLSGWLQQQEPGEYFWSVAVIQGGVVDGVNTVTKSITSEAEPFQFTLESNRMPAPTIVPVTPNPDDPQTRLVAPPGFKIEPYTKPLGTSFPTTITFRDGKMYMLTLDGNIFVLEDEDDDNFIDTVTRIFHDENDELFWATGLEFYDGLTYISDSTRISTVYDEDGDGTLDWSTFTPIVENLPSAPEMVHSNNSLVFYEDKLYVPVGSVTDHGPIIEPPYEASILRMDPDGSNIEIIATGFRNPYDIAIAPNGDMFTGENSPDQIDKELAYLPVEEINHIREGRHYGFPDVFGIPAPGIEGVERPVVELFSSSATTGLVYYSADQFPEEYRNGLFVAQFGTGTDTAMQRNLRNGYAVLFISLEPTEDGTYIGDWDYFVRDERAGGWFRPTDVTVGPDGALYIADTTRGVMIHRVTYIGEDATNIVDSNPETDATANSVDTELLERGQQIYIQGTSGAPPCQTCHSLESNVTSFGPTLRGLAAIAETRIEGMDAEAYIRQSIIDPNAFIVQGYQMNIMPIVYGDNLSDEDIDALIAFIMTLR